MSIRIVLAAALAALVIVGVVGAQPFTPPEAPRECRIELTKPDGTLLRDDPVEFDRLWELYVMFGLNPAWLLGDYTVTAQNNQRAFRWTGDPDVFAFWVTRVERPGQAGHVYGFVPLDEDRQLQLSQFPEGIYHFVATAGGGRICRISSWVHGLWPRGR